MKYLLFVLFLFAGLPAFADETLTIDQSHTAVVFSWSHLKFSNPVARFEKIKGKIVLNASDITKSSVNLTIPLDSLRTGVAVLDKQLLSDEFFAADKYPEITFKSARIVKGPMESLLITGDLAMHGISKPVVLKAKINKIQPRSASEPARAGFEADTVLRRTDYEVDKYAPAVGDEIHVHITVEAFQEV